MTVENPTSVVYTSEPVVTVEVGPDYNVTIDTTINETEVVVSNLQGPQGGQGVTGPTGPTGPAGVGATGPTGVDRKSTRLNSSH